MDRLHPLNEHDSWKTTHSPTRLRLSGLQCLLQRLHLPPRAYPPERPCSPKVLAGLALCLLALFGCEDKEGSDQSVPSTAPPARFEAVTKKSEVSEKDLDGFCDIRERGTFRLPPVSGGTEPTGARWVNLWATWCKSCVEEMPMIERWREEHGLQVLYVSADEDSGALDTFLKAHPKTPKTATMNEPGALTDWMKGLGLDEGAGLPLHVFVRADNTVACARAAAVSEHHLTLIKSLLK